MRQVTSQAILETFWSWVQETSEIPTTNEELTKALVMFKLRESI